MKYKDFIAMAAARIAAMQLQQFGYDEMIAEDETGNVISESDDVRNINHACVWAAKSLATELEHVFSDDEVDGYHKKELYEDFFEK